MRYKSYKPMIRIRFVALNLIAKADDRLADGVTDKY